MFSLAHEINGHDFGVGVAVCKDQAVGWPGKHVDADLTEQDTLGLGDVLIARTDKNVSFGQAEQAVSHARHTLDATERKQCMCAGDVRGVNDGWRDAFVWSRRRTSDDVIDARDLCGGDGHDGRGDVAITPAWHVAARRAARYAPLASDHAGCHFRFKFLQRRSLRFGEAGNVGVRVLDVTLQLCWHFFSCRPDRCGVQNHFTLVFIELSCVLEGSFVAAAFNVVEHGAHLLVDTALVAGGGVGGFFEVGDGHGVVLVGNTDVLGAAWQILTASVSACILRCKRLQRTPTQTSISTFSMADSSLPTLEDVARLAGVSTATVSRCLNAPERVATETRKRVETAVDTLGYTPNFGARALVLRRTGIVGAVIPTLASAIFARAIQAFQNELDVAGWTLVLASSDSKRETEARQIRALTARGVDGLLLVGAERDEETYRFLEKRQMPYVIGWTVDVPEGQACVGFDNAGAMAAMTGKALALGHRHFAVITASLAQNDRARNRVAGVRAALAKASLDPSALQVEEVPYQLDAAGDAFDRLMAATPSPTIVMCGNDVQAAGAIRRAQQRGLRVPADVSVTGFDNLEHAQLVDPGVTTVNVPHVDMGSRAAQELVKLIHGSVVGPPVTLPVSVVERGSLGPAPG